MQTDKQIDKAKLEAWLEKQMVWYSQGSTIHAQNGEYENAQFDLGVAEGLQLVWDYINGIKTRRAK